MTWNPEQYHKFQSERFAPFDDLVKLVNVKPSMNVIDLGCGTGELTRRLADMLPDSDVLGIDSSPEMLAKTESQVRSGLRFEQQDLTEVQDSFDLVFSNAVIQWVPDHHALIPKLISMVKPGGQLVVQLPSNHDHPSHVFVRDIAGEEPYRTALDGWVRRPPVLTIFEYAELLYQHGGPELTIYEKAYPHMLENSDGLAEWTSGTLLVPYFAKLPEDLKDDFMAEYRKRLKARWPESPVFYPFRRTLFSVTRSK